jgi:preprotein translocase subunit SecF
MTDTTGMNDDEARDDVGAVEGTEPPIDVTEDDALVDDPAVDAAMRNAEAMSAMDLDEVVDEIDVETATTAAQRERMGPFHRLFNGLTTFDFVGRRRVWFSISLAIIIVGMAALGFKGLNLGIDFKGGSTWEVLAPGVSQQQAVDAVTGAGLSNPTVQVLGGRTIEVQADLNGLTKAQQAAISAKVIAALAHLAGVPPNQVSSSFVGPTWGGEVTTKALQALIAFFVAVLAYISLRFEPKMAAAAFLAMLHDLAITIGIYAIFGFEVTPDTVIAILTILGYSLYDTVVVFDRIRDNTKPFAASGRMTYSAMVNLSMNQTLARSINTSMVAILPVLSVLLVGAEILGATTLQNYGVALTVGLLAGAYSSIFIASPLLAIMKEREEKYIAIRHRLIAKGQRNVEYSAQDAARMSMAAPAANTGSTGKASPRSAGPVPMSSTSAPQQTGPVITPRARKQKKR